MKETVYIRDLSTDTDSEIALPADNVPLKADHEYIILDVPDVPFSIPEYTNVDELNALLKQMQDSELSDSEIQALGNEFVFSEIKEAFEKGDTPVIVNATNVASNWNEGRGLTLVDDDALGLVLYSEGYSYLPFEVPENAEDYIRWDQNWFTAESEGWRKSKDNTGNVYLIWLNV